MEKEKRINFQFFRFNHFVNWNEKKYCLGNPIQAACLWEWMNVATAEIRCFLFSIF